MEEYKVTIVIPARNNFWEANKEERRIIAENFNDMLVKALSNEEIKSGVRIIRIEHRLNDRYCGWEFLKY